MGQDDSERRQVLPGSAVWNAHANAYGFAISHTYTDGNANSHSYGDSHTYTDGNADSHTHTDCNTDGYTHANTNSHGNSYSHSDRASSVADAHSYAQTYADAEAAADASSASLIGTLKVGTREKNLASPMPGRYCRHHPARQTFCGFHALALASGGASRGTSSESTD